MNDLIETNELEKPATVAGQTGFALLCALPLKVVRALVGKATIPKEAVQCELGDWWIECDYEDLPQEPWGRKVHPYHYRYTYQRLEQGYFGKWRKETQWLGRHYSMDFYKMQPPLNLT